ncbi:MAG: insulinase family protein, partial [Betaproteobacteria bacterium]
RSGAALAVNTGQIDDPKEHEGLAHFLEHMLFLGTEKFPEVTEYGNFIKSNGGRNNAYTSSDHTNYHFDVRHEAFSGALDRFSQFFIAPKFSPEFTAREVNAVHNEAMRHVQNDSRRLLGVSRELYDPASGESKFSTGNKDTLAGATPEVVRAFYEKHYSADHMALSLAGKASLDELEKLARQYFAAIPKRSIPAVSRVGTFLPRKAALRIAYVEPIKEVRMLALEFMVPATRPDFLSRPDRLLAELISYPGPGGIEELLKREGLINNISADLWERTGEYGSFLLNVSLTPAGQEQHQRVLGQIFSYLEFLKQSPFPAAFFQDRARIAQLNETYRDRGEGMDLATKLANQALFYPLEIAERATDVWGKPDEAAYRRLLASLAPDNALVSLMAKGLSTDRRERIYDTAYSYREETGAAYAALAKPPQISGFTLPGANRFMPANAVVLDERPLPLIAEPGIELYYALDTEFKRPQTTLLFRFVPVREIAGVDSAALLRLYETCLRDFLQPAIGDAQLAGVEVSIDASFEGMRLSVTGFGDSPRRVAMYVAEQMLSFPVSAERFAALKEASLRGLKSYEQTEAYALARDRRDALSREILVLPDELIATTTAATWPEVQAFGRKFFARGKLDAVVHGHTTADEAVAVTREVLARIGARPAPAAELLRRRHLVIANAENIIDAGPIAGVNSALVRDYLLPEDSAATRATAAVVANFFSSPFSTEMRTRQQLGYIVGSAATSSQRQRFFTFVIQSSAYAPDELRRRADTYIATLPAALAAIDDPTWATLISGVRANLEEKPKNIHERAEQFFTNAFINDGDWDRRQATIRALDALTREQAAAFLAAALAPATSRQRTIMLYSKNHQPTEVLHATFADRTAWKASRQFR